IAKASELAPLLREMAHYSKHLLSQASSNVQQGMVDKVKAQLAVKRLQELKLFAHATPDLLAELAECVRPLAFMPAKTVYEQEAMADRLYFISRGKVGLYLSGAAQPFLEIGPGDVFGEMALLNQQIHPTSARTESYCQLYELDMPGFARLLLQEPGLKDELRTIAMERIPALEEERDRVAYQPPEAEGLPRAEVIAVARVRPAQAFIASNYHEQAFCIDEEGQLLWTASGSQARLYRPARLSVGEDLIWIADTGNDRVLALSKADGRYVRQLAAPKLELAQPRSVFQTLQQHLLIADEGHQRLVLASTSGEMLWEYGQPQLIASPWFAEQTLKGTVLFCDRDLHMAFEVDPRSKEVLWSYGSPLQAGDGPEELHEPSCVRRLSNGATLIVDTGNHRLLLLSPVGTLMRSFEGTPEIPMVRPVHVELMASGEMWVYPEAGETVIRLGPSGQPVWQATLPK
ncbi:MAG TPA: cyclic nucleotide-binding domain-containing protein, partial [Candidatus Obscuribacterales bacterium]